MGIAVIPAPSAGGGKILKRQTLTSGTSWTVPAGVTDINVTLYAGGGGGGGTQTRSSSGASTDGGTGGTTTFTGATSASGGAGGYRVNWDDGQNDGRGQRFGMPAKANSGFGGGGAWQQQGSSQTYMSGGNALGGDGQDGSIITSTLTVTPSSSIAYSIGNGGSAGQAGSGYGAGGGAGGSGRIEIEYWV